MTSRILSGSGRIGRGAAVFLARELANQLPLDEACPLIQFRVTVLLRDAVVKACQLKPNPNHKKHKTSIKWKNLNPEFNEEFAFETRPTELTTQSLYITVFDKDYGKSNDYLGGLILGGTGSKGLRLKHWMDMIRYPDHRHEQWHNLTEDVLE